MWTGSALTVGRINGIEIRLHWLFLALVAFFALGGAASAGLAGAASVLLQLTALFVCVTLHELGHSFAAQALGIRVARITLWPLGGVAELDGRRLMDDPKAELLVTAAGPAVNVVLAVLLTPLAFLGVQLGWAWPVYLVAINVIMAVFNLLPAFPMDGGRLLRAALALYRKDHLAATETAVGVGRAVAVGMAFFAIYNPWLLLIAWFVWVTGGNELEMARRRAYQRELQRRWRVYGREGFGEALALLERLAGQPRPSGRWN